MNEKNRQIKTFNSLGNNKKCSVNLVSKNFELNMNVSVVNGIWFICGIEKRVIFSTVMLPCVNVWYRWVLNFDRGGGFC